MRDTFQYEFRKNLGKISAGYLRPRLDMAANSNYLVSFPKASLRILVVPSVTLGGRAF